MTKTTWKRASGRLLIVEAAQFLASFAFLVIALTFWASHGSEIASVLLPLASFLYGPLRVAWIIVRWSVETYRIAPEMLAVRTGVFHRQERHLGWASVVAVDEQAGLFFRVLGIRRLQLTQSDSAGGAVVFRALDPVAAADIRTLVRKHNGAATDSNATLQIGEIYRATWRELALMSLVNGRFALLAPPVLFASWGLLEDIGVSTWAFELFRTLPPALLIAISIVGFILIGTLATISRYQGFSARMTAARTLVLSYGLVEKRERHIDLKSIEGITVRRSLVEQLLRRSRLAVLTFKGADEVGASLVLPSLPDTIVRQITRSHFHEFVQDSAILSDRPAAVFRQFFRAALVFSIPAALVASLLDTGMSIAGAVAIGLIALAISTSIGRLLVLGMNVDSHDILKIERHLVTEVETYVRARSCHWVGSVHLRGADRPLFFSAHLYAGGARNFVGTHCSAESLARLREVIITVDEPAARRQRLLIKSNGATP
ncbi:PH domain-containing protein [Luethyella okanaganae]|uniref:PH domain-containing protein n=1 Tax=Luethyella okanaganae TaxID=69372 RepID=A0ABW1VGV7_9MICO